MKWIKVEDQLPGDQIEVVFYANPFEWWTGMFTPKKYLGCAHDRFEYHQHWGDDIYHEIENVTHWLPLPKPEIKKDTL